jgi:mRNA-degrading endonuclease RelE of RelBE toxin-antitoxin system
MRIILSKLFIRDYKKLPQSLLARVDRQLRQLATNIRHPSLGAKKMIAKGQMWEARVDYHHRMTFQFGDGAIVMRRVGTHEVYKKP